MRSFERLRRVLPRLASFAAVLAVATMAGAAENERPVPPLPGAQFQSAQSRALESDEANPGLLWVEQGAALWRTPAGSDGRSCVSCHGEAKTSMKGVAARYPTVDAATGRLLNLDMRIRECRTDRQKAPELSWESPELLALTAFVTRQSQGLPKRVAVEGAARPFFEAGRTFFHERQGQLDLACAQCHQERAGRHLRGDTISQGQTDGWPAYRLDWQTLGSLGRRLRACSLGVRAEVLQFGAPEYVAVELYLAWRGEGLPVASPGVRR